MTRFELTIDGKKLAFSGPSTWELLSPAQAVALMRFRRQVTTNPAVIFPALDLLYGMTKRQMRWLFDERFLKMKRLGEEEILTALDYGQAIIDTIRWTGETEPSSEFLVPYFRVLDFQYGSVSVLLQRSLLRQLYYAPTGGLANLTFGEFMRAENAYKAANLAQLASVLYRSEPAAFRNRSAADVGAGLEGDEQKEELFERLDPALLELIAMQYAACQRELQRYFGHVFPKNQTSEANNSDRRPGEKPDKTGGSWLDVAINMAKLDVTKIEQIERVNLYLALKTLDEQIRQADELDEQLEKMRRK